MVKRALAANGYNVDTSRINLNTTLAEWNWSGRWSNLAIAFNTKFGITHVVSATSEDQCLLEIFADTNIDFILLINEDDRLYFDIYRIDPRHVYMANLEYKETQRWDAFQNPQEAMH